MGVVKKNICIVAFTTLASLARHYKISIGKARSHYKRGYVAMAESTTPSGKATRLFFLPEEYNKAFSTVRYDPDSRRRD